MSKATPVFSCTNCAAQFSKWSGRCTSCGAWGSISQETAAATVERPAGARTAKGVMTRSFADKDRVPQASLTPTGLKALDALLGGGLVQGSVTLVAGEPGVGKSTFLAQLALQMANADQRVLYVTGEESPAQIRRRLERLCHTLPPSLHFLDRVEADVIAATIETDKPTLTLVDSIQSLRLSDVSGEAGSVSQVKACAATITEAAKRSQASVFLVGQVTKDGDVAGPRVLEHVVDTVLFMQGDHLHRYRLLRVVKHRFGPTDDVALLAMTEKGLEPVEDPSSELLRDRPSGVPGSCVSCLLEGHRPFLLEIQALVSPAGYGTPIRRTSGIDSARLGMMLAVLARRAGIQALDKDVYANAAGGIDARDPSVDLALAAAIASAVRDLPLDPRMALVGEIGLAGELRPVSLPEARLKELARLGFSQVIVPKGQAKHAPKSVNAKEAVSLREAFQILHLV